jgi:hypothetical protein
MTKCAPRWRRAGNHATTLEVRERFADIIDAFFERDVHPDADADAEEAAAAKGGFHHVPGH